MKACQPEQQSTQVVGRKYAQEYGVQESEQSFDKVRNPIVAAEDEQRYPVERQPSPEQCQGDKQGQEGVHGFARLEQLAGDLLNPALDGGDVLLQCFHLRLCFGIKDIALLHD